MSKERLELFAKVKQPQIRERIETREDGREEKVSSFEGYAIVFDEPSVLMCDWWEDKIFREYIDKGAISQEMLDSSDIVCTAFHNREKLLARHHSDGTGTLKLEVDEIGVKATFDFGDGPTSEDVKCAVERGDMSGMSFSFYDDDYTYTDTKGADGIIDRHISNIASIFEVTVASNPAYPATTAKCRENWESLTRNEEELLKREEEEKEAARQREDRAWREALIKRVNNF